MLVLTESTCRAKIPVVVGERDQLSLDPKTQGDARTKKHADVCNITQPEDLALEDPPNRVCPECCECWCHFTFTNPDGSERDDAEALRAEIRRLSLESRVTLEMKRTGQVN